MNNFIIFAKRTYMNFEKNGRSLIIEGVLAAADIVKSTMGPYGHRVSFSEKFETNKGLVHVDRHSRDGITVLRNLSRLFPEDSKEGFYKNRGCRLLIDSSDKTVRSVGDGTSSTAVIIAEMLSQLPDDYDVQKVVSTLHKLGEAWKKEG